MVKIINASNPFLWIFGMRFMVFSLIKYFWIILIKSAIKDEINKYNVNIAAIDHIFKQNRNDKIEIMLLIMFCLFFDKFESFKAYFTLKNEYNPIKIPKIIPIIRYSGKNPNVKKWMGFIILNW